MANKVLIVMPVILQFCNTSWIMFLYDEFLQKLIPTHTASEIMMDELLGWLRMDTQDLLIKIVAGWQYFNI